MIFQGGLTGRQGILSPLTDRNILKSVLAVFRCNTLGEIIIQGDSRNVSSGRLNIGFTEITLIIFVSQLSHAIRLNLTANGRSIGLHLKGNGLIFTSGFSKRPGDGVIIFVVGHTLRKLLSFHPSEILGNLIRESQLSRSRLSHRGNLSSNFLNQRGEFLVDLLLTAQVIGIALTLGSQARQILSLISQAQTNGVDLYLLIFQSTGLISTVPISLLGVVYHTKLIQPGYAIGDKDDIFFAGTIVQIFLRLCQASSVVGAAVSFHVRNGLHKALDTFTPRNQRLQAIAGFTIEFSPIVRMDQLLLLFATEEAGKANQS